MFQGFGLGGFAERALIHENQLAVVPKKLPFAQAALLGCGVVTGAGSVLNTANVIAGDAVVDAAEKLLAWAKPMVLDTSYAVAPHAPPPRLADLRAQLIGGYPQVGPIFA